MSRRPAFLLLLLFLGLTVGLPLASVVLAQGGQPQQPMNVQGSVILGGLPAPQGTEVLATISGTSTTKGATTGATLPGGITLPGDRYSLNVPSDDTGTSEKDGGIDGDTVTLFVGGADGYTGAPGLFQFTFGQGGVLSGLDLDVPADRVLVLEFALSPSNPAAGQAVQVQGTVSDMNAAAIADATLAISWGDGSSDSQVASASDGAFSASHIYSSGTFTVQATARKSGFVPDADSRGLTVGAAATPSPTATTFVPLGGGGGGWMPTATPTSTATATATLTSTATPTLTPTPISTLTPTATLATPVPTLLTPVPTPPTPVPATPAPTPMPTPAALPVRTPVATSTPVPGATPVPAFIPTAVVPSLGPGFTVSGLSVSPDVVAAGVPVTVRFTVTNTGASEATFTIAITVEGQVEATVTGTLAGRASRTLIHTVARGAAGAYTVGVDGLADSFSVLPAKMQLTELDVSPRNVGPEDPVTMAARVTNAGGSPGNYEVDFAVAGSTEKSFTGTLPMGWSKVLVAKTSRADPGSYSVSADGLSDQFVVLQPVVDMEIPPKILINEVATQATDEEGNILQVTGNTVRIEGTETGEIQVELPVALAPGSHLQGFQDAATGVRLADSRLEITILDEQGREALLIVAEVESTDGTGATARATLKPGTLRLEVPERVVDLGADDPLVGQVAVSISAQLNRLPEDAHLTVTTKKALSPDAYSGFELLARDGDSSISDVGATVEVTRANLENVTDVGAVALRLSVGRSWVEAHGGVGQIQVARRADDGSRGFLPTTFVGEDEEGRMVFEALSEEGFSVFALLALAPLTPDIQFSDLSVEPQVVTPGQAVEITAHVANTGSAAGSRSVILEINGETEQVRSVALEPGAETRVTFLTVQEREGTYQVRVEGLLGSFQVAAPLSPALLAVTELEVSPSRVEPGQTVSITVSATSIGAQRGKFDVSLKLNGALVDIRPVLVSGGGSEVVAFAFTPQAPGSYTVDVHGLKGAFTVQQPLSAARFTLSGLVVSPGVVQPGKSVTVAVTLVNLGEQEGTFTVSLKVNGAVGQSREVLLEGLTTLPMTFEVVRAEPGVYTVEVGGLRATFEVKAPEKPELSITMQPLEGSVAPGESFRVSVGVRNPNIFTVTTVLLLKVNGGVVESREVSLDPGQAETLFFGVTLEEPGEYTLAVDGASTTVEVSQPRNWLLITALILLILAGMGAGGVAVIHRWGIPLPPLGEEAAPPPEDKMGPPQE